MTRDGALLGKQEIWDFRIHYKINDIFDLEMCCSLCSRKKGAGDCNHTLAAPPAWTVHASLLQNRLELQWSQPVTRAKAPQSASKALQVPARTYWKTPALSRERDHSSGWSLHHFSSQDPGHNQASDGLRQKLPPKHLAALHKRC